MNQYTAEELYQLLANLFNKTLYDVSSQLEKAYIFLEVDNRYELLSCNDILKIVFGYDLNNLDLKGSAPAAIRSLIYSTSIEDVPMYLNGTPDVASWRLIIGK